MGPNALDKSLVNSHDNDVESPAGGGIFTPTAAVAGPSLRTLSSKGLKLVIAASVLVGIGTYAVAVNVILPRLKQAEARRAESQKPPIDRDGFHHPITLPGEHGTVTLPLPGQVFVMNVWLQNCPDCMPAFRAFRDMKSKKPLSDIPHVNISYGSELNMKFAKEYGLDEKIAADIGRHIVNPLGIHSFTSFLIDQQGRIRWKARPDQPDYRARLQGALELLSGDDNSYIGVKACALSKDRHGGGSLGLPACDMDFGKEDFDLTVDVVDAKVTRIENVSISRQTRSERTSVTTFSSDKKIDWGELEEEIRKQTKGMNRNR